MKTNFKRVMSLILTVLMVMTVVPFAGVAVDCTTAEGGHDFSNGEVYHTWSPANGHRHYYKCKNCNVYGYDGENGLDFINGEQPCYGGTATCTKGKICEACSTEYTEKDTTAHGNFIKVVSDIYLVSKATCQEAAIYNKSCENCKAKSEETFKSGTADTLNGHDYTNITKHNDRTHTAVCKICESTLDKVDCFDSSPEVIAPSCTTGGKNNNVCDVCGYEWESDEIDPNGHNYEEESTELKDAATCTSKATYWYGCTECDANAKDDENASDKYYEDGEMLAHVYDRSVAETKFLKTTATCQQVAVYYKSCYCGASSEGTASEATFDGDLADHAWSTTYTYNYDAKCGVNGTETAPCATPGCTASTTRDVEGSALQHVFTEEIANEAHLKDAATCTSKATYWKECVREGCTVMASDATVAANYFESGDFATHIFSEEIKDAAHLKDAATCTTKAVYWFDCTGCDLIASDATIESNYYTDEDGEKLPHSYTVSKVDEKYLAVAATCSTKAIYYKSCACGDSGVNSEKEAVFEHGDALGHLVETIPGKDPTCTEDGYTESRICKRPTGKNTTCGAVLKEKVVRKATGHKEYVSVEKTEATCTKVGHTEEKKCAVCEKLLTTPSVTTNALGHVDADDDELCDRPGCGTIMSKDDTPCSCLCHGTGLARILYVFVKLIWKLIGANQHCDCGVEHY